MLSPISYRVPESRTPFTNTELAVIERGGKKWLATGNYGGKANGRVYLIDPATGACEFRALPEHESGAYMLQTGPDGKLYIGGTAGSLTRYDPATDAIETLVKDEMTSIVWGGCVTERYVVFSAHPGEACVYDWREGKLLHVFKPVDPQDLPARAAHRVIEAPDGRVLLGMNLPQCRFVRLDPKSGERQSLVPEGLAGREWMRDATFIDARTLYVFSKGETFFYRYPSFELLQKIATPEGAEDFWGRSPIIAGRIYAMSLPDCSLRRLKEDRSGWEMACANFGDEMGSTIIKLDEEHICNVNVAGTYSRFNVRTGELFRRELDTRANVPTHALCAVPEIGKVYGAPFINMRFWEIDCASGAGRDLGRASIGGGQVNGTLWDPQTRRVLMACYTSCTVSAYDPAAGGTFPENPRVLAKIGELQMRPKGFIHDGRYLWMTSSAKYGNRGGALSRIDPLDGSHLCWRHIVKDQTPNRVVADPQRSRVYVSTEIYADCDSAPATTDTAQLVAFDTKALKVVRSSAPMEKADTLLAWVLLSPGRVLVQGRGKFFAWEPDADRFVELGPVPKDFKEVVADERGRLFASAEGHVGRLQVEQGSVSFENIAPGVGAYLNIAGGKLWFAVDREVRAIEIG